MSWPAKIAFIVKSLFLKKKLDSELSDEIRSHLELAVEANVAAGMPPEEARDVALREFGNVAGFQERARSEHGWILPEQIAHDVRLAVRSLSRAPGFTCTVLLIIAICLAANVAIFSLVNGVLLRPLPFREADRLVTVYNSYPKAGLENVGVSVPHYLERKREMEAFADAAVVRSTAVTLNGNDAPERIEAAVATPSFFSVLGVAAALGRTFTEEEGIDGKNQVVVVSDGFWREHFNRDPAIVGRTLRLHDTPFVIIGVLAPGFRYLSRDAKLWMPLRISNDDRGEDRRHSCGLEMIARLRPGVSLAAAQVQLDALNERTLQIDPTAKMVRSVGFHSTVSGLHSNHVAKARPVLLLLQTGVLFFLLIGAVNLANLFMVRATARAKEYALRQALGAGRLQLVRTLLIETLVLSITGGLFGIGLGATALRSVSVLAARSMPMDTPPGIDPIVAIAALGMAVFLGLLLVLPVIWLTVRRNLPEALTMESRGGTTTRSVHRLRHALIVVQIALTFVLLAGTGLLGLSFSRVLKVKPGFQRENLLTGAVTLSSDQSNEPSRSVAIIEKFLTALRSLPGVSSAALSSGLPFSGRVAGIAWEIAGNTAATNEFVREPLYTCQVAGDYFAALGVPLLEGRVLNDSDVQLARKVCVVDGEFAHRHWPQGGALGHRLVLPALDPEDPTREYFSIVGVVKSVKQDDLADQGVHGALYVPMTTASDFMVAVRTSQASEAAGSDLREAVRRVDPSLPLYDLKTMAARVDDSLSHRRTPLVLAGIFSGTSLLLAAVGIYGVLAYAVAQRRREIGVRIALGALPEQIRRQFLGLGLRLLSVGLPLGVIGAWATGRGMAGLLYGITPTNPGVLGGTAMVLAAVTLLACLLPARRAAKVSPVEAMRCE